MASSLSLSPLSLFLHAGFVGKFVMIVLALASIWCWALIVEGAYAARKLRRDLADADEAHSPLLTGIVAAGQKACGLTVIGESVGEKRQRVSEAMRRTAREALARAEGGLPNLAVIASVSPFVGLFGTVWGIMSSFVGIAAAKDTSLAVVAPGIAEALAATAYGLAAAIPASVGYTRIGAGFSRAGQQLSHWIEARAVALIVAAQQDGTKR
ncbi:MotA/TolQ/ExbB proton channel family protein [Rhodoblastus sp.]|uniref:MotA/TolQ/ExbB proton channel family protein n=1 Tax=Rhodoblastus sp. TaxID=1962975 RepID=UPI003F99843D